MRSYLILFISATVLAQAVYAQGIAIGISVDSTQIRPTNVNSVDVYTEKTGDGSKDIPFAFVIYDF